MNEIWEEPKPLSENKITLSRIKRRILKHVWIARVVLLASFFLAFCLFVIFLATAIRKTRADYYFGLARNFVFTPQGNIRSFAGRTNILILGKGGKGHEAGDLTDTIIFASVFHTKPAISLISISRDIWIGEIRAKLNSAYYWGNQKEAQGGITLAKSLVEEIVGEPVHYAVVVDFSGFKKIVDVLGGIEVDVERGFTDAKYPIPGRENDPCGGDAELRCRYETISFTAGREPMDGETALKFVRSRNAEGEEGTDWAREARQQKVLTAIRQKALSKEVLLSPKKILALWRGIEESLETDVDATAGATLARRLLDARNNIASYVLPESLLVNPPKSGKFDNLYVFIPKAGDWEEIHKWVKCTLGEDVCG